jgi:hypothetical protein
MNLRAEAVGLILALLCGCAPSSNEKMLGSHRVKIKPGSVTVSTSHQTSSSGPTADTYYEFSSGSTRVVIKNEELIINDQTYGMLSPNDPIDVDHGRVLVYGKPVQGRKLTEKEIQGAAPSAETTGEVGGYPITVRPGTSSSTKTSAFGKYTFTAGETVIVVEDDALSVNGKSYGKLKKGDAISVELGRVIVSGKERSATK